MAGISEYGVEKPKTETNADNNENELALSISRTIRRCSATVIAETQRTRFTAPRVAIKKAFSMESIGEERSRAKVVTQLRPKG